MDSSSDRLSDRLIDKKKLRELVPFSSSHIARLEKAGDFPKRVKIGQSRIAWSEKEVLTWIASKKQG